MKSKIILLNSFVGIYLFFLMIGFIFTPYVVSAQESIERNATINAGSNGIVEKVAAGELLPVSVKLSNFGGGKSVDVLIQYEIFSDKGEKIYSTNETVAVETTANFVKIIQIPYGTAPGTYTAKTSIIYDGQLVPATTQFNFKVERKILGLFESAFFLYGGITIFVSIFMVLFVHLLTRHNRKVRSSPIDYFDIPRNERTFYEILSDVIMEMRERVGDKAIDIAAGVEGLKIDKKSGRVLSLSRDPAKIISDLVSAYEKLLGIKVLSLVDRTGLEPATPSLQMRCSTR